MSAHTYSTGKEPFEDTLHRIFTLIIKARALGPKSVEMNFNDYAGEFMGELDEDVHSNRRFDYGTCKRG